VTVVTYRAISDYFLKLNVAFFSHWRLEAHIATQNIGGDIPIDVPTNQNIGGDTSPASPAGLTPMPTVTPSD